MIFNGITLKFPVCLLLGLLFIFSGCGDIEKLSNISFNDKEDDPESVLDEFEFGGTTLCSEGLVSISSNRYISDGKVAMNLKAQSSSDNNLKMVRFFLSSDNLTSVTLKIYDGEGSTPEDGNLLASSVVTTGLGSSDYESSIDFELDTPFAISGGSTYYFVLEGEGGAFRVGILSSSYADGQIELFNGTSWTTSIENIFAVRFSYDC